MKKRGKTINVSVNIDTEVDVDIDPSEVLEKVSDEDLLAEMASRGLSLSSDYPSLYETMKKEIAEELINRLTLEQLEKFLKQ